MWSVLRIDDNGNRFVVASFSTRVDAEAEARRYEARGHKQVYFVESDHPPSPELLHAWSAPRCPLCGEENDCAVSRTGSTDTPCWCRDIVIDAATLARVPDALRNRACLCRRCAGTSAAAPDGD